MGGKESRSTAVVFSPAVSPGFASMEGRMKGERERGHCGFWKGESRLCKAARPWLVGVATELGRGSILDDGGGSVWVVAR